MRYFLIRFDATVKIAHVLVNVHAQCHIPSTWLTWGVTCHRSSSPNHLDTTMTCKKIYVDCNQYLFIPKIWVWLLLLLSWLFWLGFSAYIPRSHYGKMMRNPSIHLDVVVKYSQKCDMDILLPKPYMYIEILIASSFGIIKGTSLQKKPRKRPNRDKALWWANPRN